MLSQRYAPESLNLVSKADWQPYPTAQQRDFWTSLPDSVRKAYIRRGEVALQVAFALKGSRWVTGGEKAMAWWLAYQSLWAEGSIAVDGVVWF